MIDAIQLFIAKLDTLAIDDYNISHVRTYFTLGTEAIF